MSGVYDSGYWGEEQRNQRIEESVNWAFEYAGLRRYIPTIYHYKYGIIFDIITPLDEKKLWEFYHTYLQKYENKKEIMTETQRLVIEEAHPYQEVVSYKLSVNGNIPRNVSSQKECRVPWDKDILEHERQVYAAWLKDTPYFACKRISASWSEEIDSCPITSLKMQVEKKEYFYPLEKQFYLPFHNVEHVEKFVHPLTNTFHTLYFQDVIPMEIPYKKQKLYTAKIAYEIDPPLPEDNRLQFHTCLEKQNVPVAESIGLVGTMHIGGTASIFMEGETGKVSDTNYGKHGLPIHYGQSKVKQELEKECEVEIGGLYMPWYQEGELEFRT